MPELGSDPQKPLKSCHAKAKKKKKEMPKKEENKNPNTTTATTTRRSTAAAVEVKIAPECKLLRIFPFLFQIALQIAAI